MKLCGKDYIVPELNFDEVAALEQAAGVPVFDLMESKHTMTVARAFVQVVTGADTDEANVMLTEHIKQGGYKALGAIVDAFVDAMLDSDFTCALLGVPTKAEREKAAQKSESPAET